MFKVSKSKIQKYKMKVVIAVASVFVLNTIYVATAPSVDIISQSEMTHHPGEDLNEVLPRVSFLPLMPMIIQSGQNIIIYCNVSGKEPIQVYWHTEDFGPIPPSTSVNGNYLQFMPITSTNTGRYYCTAENIYGKVTKAADVFVNRKEFVDYIPEPRGVVHEVVVGETVSLYCSSPNQDSSSGIHFKWRKEYGDIPRSATIDSENRLILTNIRVEDTGRYLCEMTTPDNTVSTNFVDIQLRQLRPLLV